MKQIISLELFNVKQSNTLNLNFNDQIIPELFLNLHQFLKFEMIPLEIDKNIFIKIHSILNINSKKISEDQDFWRFISFSERGRFLNLIKKRYFKQKFRGYF